MTLYVCSWSLARRSECSNPDFDTGNGFPDPISLYFDISHDTFVKKYICSQLFISYHAFKVALARTMAF